MRLLMVHGMAQGGQDHQTLSNTWRDTLETGFRKNGVSIPGNVSIDFPFYGDILDEHVRQSALPTPKDVLSKGEGENSAFENFTKVALQEIRTAANFSDDEIEQEMNPDGVRDKGMQNWEWVQAIVRVIDKRFTGIASYSIENFIEEVFVYLHHKPAKAAAEKTLIDMMTDEPTVVIGHSLGSVVAYRTLLEHGEQMDLRGFVTVGSPLGIKSINSQFGFLEHPSGGDHWFNAYDTRDIVALNPLDNQHFPVNPAIKNFNGVKNQTDNRHGIIGYLDDPEVASHIFSYMN